MSDFQQRREYKSEWALAHLTVPIDSPDKVRALVSLIETRSFYPARKRGIIVSSTLGNARAFYSAGTIHLPVITDPNGRWAWTDLVICHEVAHHIAPEDGHGKVFTYRLLQILESIGRSRLAAALREQYDLNGVAVYDPEQTFAHAR